ncbi:hypothetical protein CHL76_05460 [Marinococcus halophilus]|uniref:Uncharacterized protein n=1 Tax=Marinococcus halophilus TaxID=1371 RepID=A0A510Y5Q5_MARHA|nr:hypothetical protein [Marinococcus halophilus]OZT80775.1 hypothetical protein CHL76_05460 [Marinococcus halophilus]GEK57827.1 hypothetical protein MHA01_07320 [Marinococcus halophilus]
MSQNETNLSTFFAGKLQEAKTQFERTIDCKHTAFDDLYPYMNEQPQFFWYKRYVAWQELLTTVELAEELNINWQKEFKTKQQNFIESKVLDAKVLDEWYGKQRTEA